MSRDSIIPRLINRNLYAIVRSIFSYLSGDDIFNLFLASEVKTTYLNGDFWHTTQAPENSMIWNKLKQKRCTSLEEMKQKGDLQLTDLETENLLFLLTIADYHQLEQHTNNHKKTDGQEEFALVLPEVPAGWFPYSIWLNDNVISIVLRKSGDVKLVDGSYKCSLGMATVLLYDSRTFHMINAISMRGNHFHVLLPKSASNDSVGISISGYGQHVFLLWDAFSTGKVLSWCMNPLHLPSRGLSLKARYDRCCNSLPRKVFLETEYGRTCRQTILENTKGNRFDIDRFTMDRKIRSLRGRKKLAWFVDGNEFHCVAGLSRTDRDGCFLHSCQIRAKEDFSLLKTVRVKYSSTKRPTSGFEIPWLWRDTSVIYLLGDRFLIIGNHNLSSFEVRSIEDMALVHVFNQKRLNLGDQWESAKVKNGYLIAIYGPFELSVAVWRLPDDLLEQCDKCLQDDTVGSTDLLFWEQGNEALKCKDIDKLDIDEFGLSYFNLEDQCVRITISQLLSGGQLHSASERTGNIAVSADMCARNENVKPLHRKMRNIVSNGAG